MKQRQTRWCATVAVVLATVVMSLAGCSWRDMDAVMRVEGQSLTQQQYSRLTNDDQVKRLAELITQGRFSADHMVLLVFRQAQQLTSFAQANHQTVDAAKVATSTDQYLDKAAQGLQLPGRQALSQPARDLLGWLAQADVADEAMQAAVEKHALDNPAEDPAKYLQDLQQQWAQYQRDHVQVNPRYGTWDSTKGEFKPLFGGGLSTPSSPVATMAPVPISPAPDPTAPASQVQ